MPTICIQPYLVLIQRNLFYLVALRGGVGIFYKKSLSSKIKPIKSNNRRVCGLVINLATNFTCLLLSVYLPCDNYCSIVNREYNECIDYIES